MQRNITTFFAQPKHVAQTHELPTKTGLTPKPTIQSPPSKTVKSKFDSISVPKRQRNTDYVKIVLAPSPYQPSDQREIPAKSREVKGKRVTEPFQTTWFARWKWLHYVPHLGGVLCYVCAQAYQDELLGLHSQLDPAFLWIGFKNWTKATTKFTTHESSAIHILSVDKLKQKTLQQPVNCLMSKKADVDRVVAKKWLKILFTTIQYLARQGLALRGHNSDEGNLQQMMLTRCRDDPSLMSWYNKKENWTSPQHQNEILEMFFHTIIRALVTEIKKSGVFSVIMDGTQDVSGREQESICLRYLDADLKPREVFIGFYHADSTTGKALANILKDGVLRVGLDMNFLRFQAYDGASNMAGKENGCQAIIKKTYPLVLYVHCGPHVTNLVAKTSCSELAEIRNALKHVQDLGK